MTKNPKPATTTPTTAVFPDTVDPEPAGTIVADVDTAPELFDGTPDEVRAAVELAALEDVVATRLLVVPAALDSSVELAGGADDSGLAVDEGASLELLSSPPELLLPQLGAPIPLSCKGEIQPPCTLGRDSELEVSAAAVR